MERHEPNDVLIDGAEHLLNAAESALGAMDAGIEELETYCMSADEDPGAKRTLRKLKRARKMLAGAVDGCSGEGE